MTEDQKKLNTDQIHDFVRDVIKETAAVVQNATKDENSGLIRDVRVTMEILKAEVIDIKNHLKVVKETSEKHADLINQSALVLKECVITSSNTVKCIEVLQTSVNDNSKEISNISKDVFAGKIGFGIIVTLGAVIVGLATWVYNRDITRLENNTASYEEIRA